MSILNNLIRVGRINSVKPTKGYVDVLFDDRDDLVASDLPLLNFEYNIPSVGDQVLCIFLANGLEQGFCLGSFYSEAYKPPVQESNIYRKQFDDGTYIQYNQSTNQLKITSKKPLEVSGDLLVQGNVTAQGRIIGSNIGS